MKPSTEPREEGPRVSKNCTQLGFPSSLVVYYFYFVCVCSCIVSVSFCEDPRYVRVHGSGRICGRSQLSVTVNRCGVLSLCVVVISWPATVAALGREPAVASARGPYARVRLGRATPMDARPPMDVRGGPFGRGAARADAEHATTQSRNLKKGNILFWSLAGARANGCRSGRGGRWMGMHCHCHCSSSDVVTLTVTAAPCCVRRQLAGG